MPHALTSLGLTASDVKAIIGLIVVVFIVLSYIVKAIKKEVDTVKKRSESDERDTGPQTTTAKERLDALAARRREELRRLSQQRPTEPTNLTMPERVDRERARAQYQARAEQLKGYREPAPVELEPIDMPEPVRTPTVDPEREAREMARQRAAAERARRVAAARQQQGEVAAARRAEAERRAAAARRRREEERQEDVPVVVLENVVEPAPAKLGKPQGRQARSRWAKPSRQTLRDALIFKEILDPPLALRPPQE